MGNDNPMIFNEVLPTKLIPAMNMMRDALFYSRQSGSELWEYAVELKQVLDLGLTLNDVRWLARSGLMQHAIETTCPNDRKRSFQLACNTQLAQRSCFVISAKGLAAIQQMDNNQDSNEPVQAPNQNGHSTSHVRTELDKPIWDPESRELRFQGILIKQFKWRAANQERLLSAFQEENWPTLIDDPLPPTAEMDPKRRLHDTIKCLNRNHLHPLIRFHGDGTGEGVIWRHHETV